MAEPSKKDPKPDDRESPKPPPEAKAEGEASSEGASEAADASDEKAEDAAEEAAEEEEPTVFSDDLRRSFLRVEWLLFVGCLLVFLAQFWIYNAGRRDSIEFAEQTVMRNVKTSAEFFSNRTELVKRKALEIGQLALATDGRPDQVAQLEAQMAPLPAVGQIDIVYGGDASRPLHALILKQRDHKVQTTVTDNPTPPEWYADALRGPHWVTPFVMDFQGRQQIVVAYQIPLSATAGGPAVGALRLMVSMDHLRNALSSAALGRIGFGILIARDGRFVCHPIESFMLQGKRVLEVSQEEHEPAIGLAAENALRGESGLLPRIDPVSGQPSWLVYTPIEKSDWIALYNIYTEEFLPTHGIFRKRLIDTSVWGSLALFFFLTIVLKLHKGSNRRFWMASVVFTMLCFGDMALLWSSSLDRPTDTTEAADVMSRSGLQKLEQGYNQAAKAEGVPKPLFIPTGVYIQSATIGASGDAIVSGYVWQKYRTTLPSDFARGIIFPDDDKSTTLREAKATYIRKEDNEVTIGWAFHVDLRQNFSYQQYPFDRQAIQIRLWPIDFDKNVVLVPDFDAYDALNPHTRPGLDARFAVGGFDATTTRFSFADSTTTTNFGIPDYMGQNAFPDLVYNIELRRQWLGPLMSNLFPLLMVLFTVFVNFMSFSKDDKPWGLYGTIAGLFFTSLLAHLKLRDVFSVHVINYLEYFYLVTYLMIVLVAANSYIVHAIPDHRWLSFRKGILARLAFWPLVSLTLLIVTFRMFY